MPNARDKRSYHQAWRLDAGGKDVMRTFVSSALSLSVLVIGSWACTTTATVGENTASPPGDGDGSLPGESPVGDPPSPAPDSGTLPVDPPDTKGVAFARIIATQRLGQVDLLSGEQPGATRVNIALYDAAVTEEPLPSGDPGSCTRVRNETPPVIGSNPHQLNIPITVSVSAGGKTKAAEYSASQGWASASFIPALPDGSPITVTFGPEIPALAGKSVTLPARATTLASPPLRAHHGIFELRGYTPGTNFTPSWSNVAGSKSIVAAGAFVPMGGGGYYPKNVLRCAVSDSATSFVVSSADMAFIMEGMNLDMEYPYIDIVSRQTRTETVAGIKISEESLASPGFQLNANP